MSINNINNLQNLANTVNRGGADLGTNQPALNALSKGDIDWFSSASTGKTTPITAQDQFGPDTPIDDMVNAIVGQLGLQAS